MRSERFGCVLILTGTWPWWWVWCRGPYWALRPCCTWTTAVGGACACGRSRAATGCTAAEPRAGRTWQRPRRRASCCPWSIPAGRNNQTFCSNADTELYQSNHLELHLVDVSTVLEGLRVIDVVHKADHVAGQVGLGQDVEIWHHLVQLAESGQETEGLTVSPELKLEYKAII